MAEPERDKDIVLRRVKEQIPGVTVDQLKVIHPTDDDNLWYFDLPEARSTIQIEGYELPFLIETDEQSRKDALKGATVGEAVEIITRYLQSVKAGTPLIFEGPFYWSHYHDATTSSSETRRFKGLRTVPWVLPRRRRADGWTANLLAPANVG